MRITRRIAALLTAGVATMALAACQSGADPSSSAADDAVEATTSEAPRDGYTALTAADFVERSTAAQADMSTMRYKATLSGPAAEAQGLTGAAMEGAVVTGETAADTAMQMTMEVEGATFDMMLVGGDFYMNMGPITQDMYLHVTGEDASRAELEAMMEQLEQANISGQTKAMDGAVSEVTELGTETINGVETHHYAVTVDLSKAKDLESLGIDKAAAKEMGTMEFEYFLDAEDIPHRVVTTIPDAGQDLVATMDITDQGEPIEITAPPADQIIDPADMGM
ncbi:hypothetical protein [Myceligenerans xiligouense]|uniref:hypothetical protein n=1 Tax=Myceligenerans xiligouense TaxID=253184 RepID=UPI001B86F691|nr:hypothetical protein [Myceligenerans xiligouense]